MFGTGLEAFWKSGSGRKALPEVREWLGGRTGCLRGTSGYLGVVERRSRMFEVVGRPSRMSGSGWEALPDIWE